MSRWFLFLFRFCPVLIFSLGTFHCSVSKNIPVIEVGVLDLKNFDFKKNSSFSLDGNWEFYENCFFEFDSLSSSFNHCSLRDPYFLKVPSEWGIGREEGSSIPQKTKFGSYRLKVLLPENDVDWDLSLGDIGSAYQLYVNGHKMGGNGKIVKSEEEGPSVSMYRRSFRISKEIVEEREELEVVILVSNFSPFRFGIFDSIYISNSSYAEREKFLKFILHAFVFGALFIMGLYQMSLYSLWKKDQSSLYFSIFCFIVAIRDVSVQDRVLLDLFPEIPFYIVHKLEVLTFSIGGPVFCFFIHSLFPRDVSKKWVFFFAVIGVFFSFIYLVTPLSFYLNLVWAIYPVSILGIVYFLSRMVLVIRRKREGGVFLIFSLALFFPAIVNDILQTLGAIHSVQLGSYAFLIFICSQAVLLSRRFALSFHRVETLSEELGNLNSGLERIVEEKTFKLNESLASMRSNLNVAKKIQTSLFPVDTTSIGKLNIVCNYQPMEEVGGDLFDIVELSGGVVRVFLADATGHGVQAALVTMLIKGEYEGLKENPVSPSLILSQLNNVFLDKYKSLHYYFTCFLIDIDVEQNKIVYSTAGHPPQLLLRDSGSFPLSTKGKLLGFLKDINYIEKTEEFHKGDKILLFSDGIYEEFNEEKEEYGDVRLVSSSMNHRHHSLDGLVNGILSDVDSFLEGAPKQDDITLIAIEIKS